MASKMCLGVTRLFLLSLAALPASSRISAESTMHEEPREHRTASIYRWLQMHRTCQVLQYSSHVDWSSNTDSVFGKPSFNIAQHPSHREDHASLSRPGRLGDLLLPSSTRHDAWGTKHDEVYRSCACISSFCVMAQRISDIKNQTNMFCASNYAQLICQECEWCICFISVGLYKIFSRCSAAVISSNTSTFFRGTALVSEWASAQI